MNDLGYRSPGQIFALPLIRVQRGCRNCYIKYMKNINQESKKRFRLARFRWKPGEGKEVCEDNNSAYADLIDHMKTKFI